MHVGNQIGLPLKENTITLVTRRGNYAQLCVWVDLSQLFAPMLTIGGDRCMIEYEGLHLICFHCGCYGHWAKERGDNIIPKASKHGERFPNANIQRKTKPLVLQDKWEIWRLDGGSKYAKASNCSNFTLLCCSPNHGINIQKTWKLRLHCFFEPLVFILFLFDWSLLWVTMSYLTNLLENIKPPVSIIPIILNWGCPKRLASS